MKTKSTGRKTYSAVPMHHLGINSIALTHHDQLVSIGEKFETDPDHSWFNGMGKESLHKYLLDKLQRQDQWFEAHPEQAVKTNASWVTFLDDCVVLAVLDAVIRQQPLALLHPDCWQDWVKHPKNPYTAKKRPSLLPNLPVVYCH